jgi:hypothetical protein
MSRKPTRTVLNQSATLESIKRDIADRLRPTCAAMAEDEFDKMVTRMALIEWKHFNDATPTRQVIISP